MEILFIQLLDDVEISFQKIVPYDWFCGQGSHIF